MEKINDVKIIVPSKITITDGKIQKNIYFDGFDDMRPEEYLKICMELGAYTQEGVLISKKY